MASLFPEDINISDDLLTCGLCQKTLNLPKLLPCQHSFCKDCLIRNISASDFTVTCPTCERIAKVEKGDIDKIPDNYLVPILLEQRAAPIEYCLSCQFDDKKTKAIHKCLDCQDTFCAECKKFHTFSSQTRNHKVVEVREIQEGKYNDYLKVKKVKKCQKHSTEEREIPLEFYCHDCQYLVCTHCISLEHQAHSCTLMDLIEEKERVTLQDTIKQVADIQDKESRISDHLDNITASLKNERETTEKQVYQAADEIYALVDKIKEDKLQKVKNHYEEELEKLTKIRQKQQQLKNQTNTMKSFADNFLQYSSKVDFVSHFKDVEFRVKDFLDKKDLYIITKHIKLQNKACDDAVEIVKGVLGRIIFHEKVSEMGSIIGEPQILFDIQPQPKMGLVCGLTVTEGNDIIAVGGSKIGVFGNDGKYKRWIYCEGLKEAADVTVKGNKIYIADNLVQERKVIVIDMSSKKQETIKMPPKEQEFHHLFGCIMSLAVDDNGNIFIAFNNTHMVYKWSPPPITSEPFLKTSTQPGQQSPPEPFLTESTHPGLQSPQSLCTTPQQELVVSNYDSNNIQAYNGNGELLWQYDGSHDTGGIMELRNPNDGNDFMMWENDGSDVGDRSTQEVYPNICCDGVGKVYVWDAVNQRILVVHKGTNIGVIKTDWLQNLNTLAINSNRQLIISLNNGLTNERKLIKMAFWQ